MNTRMIKRRIGNYLFAFVVLLSFTNLSVAQDFVLLSDNTGFDRTAYVEDLEAATQNLKLVFREIDDFHDLSGSNSIEENFKVFDHGFYRLNADMTNGIDLALTNAVATSNQSPYYILFARESSDGKIFSKLHFKLSLPTGLIDCDYQSRLIGDVEEVIDKNSLDSPRDAMELQLLILDLLDRALFQRLSCCPISDLAKNQGSRKSYPTCSLEYVDPFEELLSCYSTSVMLSSLSAVVNGCPKKLTISSGSELHAQIEDLPIWNSQNAEIYSKYYYKIDEFKELGYVSLFGKSPISNPLVMCPPTTKITKIIKHTGLSTDCIVTLGGRDGERDCFDFGGVVLCVEIGVDVVSIFENIIKDDLEEVDIIVDKIISKNKISQSETNLLLANIFCYFDGVTDHRRWQVLESFIIETGFWEYSIGANYEDPGAIRYLLDLMDRSFLLHSFFRNQGTLRIFYEDTKRNEELRIFFDLLYFEKWEEICPLIKLPEHNNNCQPVTICMERGKVLAQFIVDNYRFSYTEDAEKRVIIEEKSTSATIAGGGGVMCQSQSIEYDQIGESLNLLQPVIVQDVSSDSDDPIYLHIGAAIGLVELTNDASSNNNTQYFFAIANGASLLTGLGALRLGIGTVGKIYYVVAGVEVVLESANILMTYNSGCKDSKLCEDLNKLVSAAQIATLGAAASAKAYVRMSQRQANDLFDLVQYSDDIDKLEKVRLLNELGTFVTDGHLIKRFEDLTVELHGNILHRDAWVEYLGKNCDLAMPYLKKLGHKNIEELARSVAAPNKFMADLGKAKDDFVNGLNTISDGVGVKAWKGLFNTNLRTNIPWLTRSSKWLDEGAEFAADGSGKLTKNGEDILQIKNDKILPDKYDFDPSTGKPKTGGTEVGDAANGYQVYKHGDDISVRRVPETSGYTQSEIDFLTELPNGHALQRHGADVTDDALIKRSTTNIAPDGANAPPAGGLSTKFSSDQAVKDAIENVKPGTPAFDAKVQQPNGLWEVEAPGNYGYGFKPNGTGGPQQMLKVTAVYKELPDGSFKLFTMYPNK